MALRTPDRETDNSVYDDDKPSWRDPGAIGNLERSFGAPSATDEDLPDGHPDKKRAAIQALAGDLLKGAEASSGSGASDLLGGGYRGNDNSRIGRALKFSMSPSARKKTLIGGGIVGVALAGFISAFLALVPLKIVGIVNNIQGHFFATSESAVDKQSDNLMSYYVKKHVLPSLGRQCPNSRVNKDCMGDIKGASKAEKLYQGWKDARLETKLAENYGITFEKKVDGYNMTVPGEKDTKIPLDFTDPKNTKSLNDLTTSQVRSKFHEAFENETKMKRVMYRFKVGRLLERKYGIKRCVVACDTKDSFADWKGKEKQAAKNFLVDRVLTPNSEAKGLLLECVFKGGCEDPASPGKDGEKRDKYQEELAQKLASYQEKYGTEAVTKIISDSDIILEKGFAAYAAEKVIGAVATDSAGVAAGQAVEKGVPIIGWIDGGAKLISTTANAGGALKKWAFVANSTAMVSFYQMYRTHADEIKSGHVTADLAGSFSSALDAGAKKDGTGEAAEDSPLYQDMFGSKSGSSTALENSLLPGKASAAAKEGCQNGPIPAGQLLCPEESLKTSNFITTFSGFFQAGQPLYPLKLVADAEQKTLGKVTGFLSDKIAQALELLPPYKAATTKIAELSSDLTKKVTDNLLPSPITDDMSGHRAVDMLIGGGDVAGNTMAEQGIGGQKLTNGQVAEIRNDQLSKEQDQFRRQPFFARMFDTQSPYSLITRVAMAMPTSANTTLKTSFASLLSNPFGKLTHSLAMVLSPARAFAANPPSDDPFGVPQFGYALNNPVFTTDPETYTDAYCSKLNDAWNAATTVDPDTGMDVHTTTNPCLLTEAAVGSAGGYYNADLLSPGDISTTTDSGGGGGGSSQGPLAPGAFSWPVDIKGSAITQCAGTTLDANGFIVKSHPGVDISQAPGTPVYAVADGVVAFAGDTDQTGPNYGHNYVVIQHSNGYTTGYGHMNSMSVKQNDHVTQGQQIGTIGNQGYSKGPHLHFNVKKGGWTGYDNNNVDPFKNGLQIPPGEANKAGCSN